MANERLARARQQMLEHRNQFDAAKRRHGAEVAKLTDAEVREAFDREVRPFIAHVRWSPGQPQEFCLQDMRELLADCRAADDVPVPERDR